MTQTPQEFYIETLEKKADAYDRLFDHYNDHHPITLSDFILTDPYYGDEEE